MTFSFSVIVKNEGGLHARPTSTFVQYFITNEIAATIRYAEREVSAHSMLDVLSLCVPKGGTIHMQLAQDQQGRCGTIQSKEVERAIKELFDVAFMC